MHLIKLLHRVFNDLDKSLPSDYLRPVELSQTENQLNREANKQRCNFIE